MSTIVPAVAKAIEEIRCTFDPYAVQEEPDGSGGAIVVVKDIPMGFPYVQARSGSASRSPSSTRTRCVSAFHERGPSAVRRGRSGRRLRDGGVSRPASYPGFAPIEQAEPRDGHRSVEVAEGHPMDEEANMKSWRLTIPAGLYAELQRHLFPGDRDEHGAVILAGTCASDRGLRLVAREVHLAKDGVDYVPGKRGYRMLKAEFIQSRILHARDRRLAYLAIHNHGGTDSVGFSGDDIASHERGYPALLDIARGMPVGALVFARSAVAGDLWFPGCDRAPLSHATVIGHRRRLLFPMPERKATAVGMYDRQSRLFGDAGQELLRRTRVGNRGAGRRRVHTG